MQCYYLESFLCGKRKFEFFEEAKSHKKNAKEIIDKG